MTSCNTWQLDTHAYITDTNLLLFLIAATAESTRFCRAALLVWYIALYSCNHHWNTIRGRPLILVQFTNIPNLYGLNQIWFCKRYPKIGPDLSGPKRGLLICKDHGPIEFGTVPNLDILTPSARRLGWDEYQGTRGSGRVDQLPGYNFTTRYPNANYRMYKQKIIPSKQS